MNLFGAALRIKHMLSPANPVVGESKVYMKSDGMLYCKNSAGIETAVGPPTGSIMMWPTTTAPAGYLACNGGTFSSVTYPALAALLGDTFGTHTGTTYYLPDFRARSPIGIGGAAVPALPGSYSFTIGQKFGENTHAQTLAEMAAHDHGSNTGSTQRATDYIGYPIAYFGDTSGIAYGSAYTGGRLHVGDTSNAVFPGHSHSIRQDGSSTPFNVTHAVLGINYMIKT